jgi:hypothetical protein
MSSPSGNTCIRMLRGSLEPAGYRDLFKCLRNSGIHTDAKRDGKHRNQPKTRHFYQLAIREALPMPKPVPAHIPLLLALQSNVYANILLYTPLEWPWEQIPPGLLAKCKQPHWRKQDKYIRLFSAAEQEGQRHLSGKPIRPDGGRACPTTCAAFRIEALSLLPRIPNLRPFTSPRTGNSHSNPPRRIGIDLKR